MILGVAVDVTVEDLQVTGVLRVEVLMSSEVQLPAVQNVSYPVLSISVYNTVSQSSWVSRDLTAQNYAV